MSGVDSLNVCVCLCVLYTFGCSTYMDTLFILGEIGFGDSCSILEWNNSCFGCSILCTHLFSNIRPGRPVLSWLIWCFVLSMYTESTVRRVFTSLGMCPWYQPWLLMSAALSFSSSSSSLRSFSGGDSRRYFSLENCKEQTQEYNKTWMGLRLHKGLLTCCPYRVFTYKISQYITLFVQAHPIEMWLYFPSNTYIFVYPTRLMIYTRK